VPELPDVEGFRRYLARHAQGERIVRVEAPDRMLVRNRTPRSLNDTLRGNRFAEPRRHGKWLFAPVGSVELVIHFGMTGLLRWAGPGDRDRGERDRGGQRERGGHRDGGDRHPHDRVIFVCEHGELRYNNMRRFGGVWLARDQRERDRVTGRLGPDAASLTEQQLEQLLASRRGGIKAALMDQRLIAGIGNLLSDEILWRARLRPGTEVPRLSRQRRRVLFAALRAAVGESIRYGRVPHGRRWLTRVRDDRDPRCPRCGTRLRRSTVAGRTACWCARCQF
jgi:formamidopyrimidine-DNA glycosylase